MNPSIMGSTPRAPCSARVLFFEKSPPMLNYRTTLHPHQGLRRLLGALFSAALLYAGAAHAKTCAAPADNLVCTDEDVAATLSTTDFLPGGGAFTSINMLSSPTSGGVTNNSNLVYPNSPAISYSDINSGLVVWKPDPYSTGSSTSIFKINGGAADGKIITLTLNITPINNPPKINIDQALLQNPNFTAPTGSATIPFWELSGNVQRNNGLVYNYGNSTPNGIAQQVINTVPGSSYTITLQTSKAGNSSSQQKLQVSALNGNQPIGNTPAATDVLTQQVYGQDLSSQTLTFVASGSLTTIRIADASTDTINTDIVMTSLDVTGPVSGLRTTPEDTPLIWRSNANPPPITISDVDGTSGTYTLTLSVTNGTLALGSTAGITFNSGSQGSASMTISGTQTDINAALDGLTYTPSANYYSPNANTDKLTLQLNDNGNTGQCSSTDTKPCPLTTSGVVPLQVLPVNDAPVAVADSMTVVSGGTATTLIGGATSVLANDTDIDGPSLTAILVTGPTHGTLVLNANGTFSYTSDGSAATSDSFTYKANDGQLDSNTVTVSITITPANHPPVANNDSFSTQADTALTIPSAQLLINDSDADSDTLSVQSVQSPQHGNVSLSNGSIVFTPTPGFAGDASFTYTVSDGKGGTATATVTVKVAAKPAPVPVGGAGLMAAMTILLAGMAGRRLSQRRK